jgi:F0F1-type ATP synthase assembly protein I
VDDVPWGLILTIITGMLLAIITKKKQSHGKDKKLKKINNTSSKSEPIVPNGIPIRSWLFGGILVCLVLGLIMFFLLR